MSQCKWNNVSSLGSELVDEKMMKSAVWSLVDERKLHCPQYHGFNQPTWGLPWKWLLIQHVSLSVRSRSLGSVLFSCLVVFCRWCDLFMFWMNSSMFEVSYKNVLYKSTVIIFIIIIIIIKYSKVTVLLAFQEINSFGWSTIQLKIHQSRPNIYTLFWRFELSISSRDLHQKKLVLSSSESWCDYQLSHQESGRRRDSPLICNVNPDRLRGF